MPLTPRKRKAARDERLATPDYVVLGMIGLGIRSGYDIKETVESSIRFFWTISRAQIYPSLKRLEAAKLVAGRSEPQGKRPRRDFEITAAGEAALRQWLSNEEAMPFELRDVGMLKLFFADSMDRSDARALLAAVARRSEERLSELGAVEETARAVAAEGNEFPLLTLHMGIAFHRAMLESCHEFDRLHYAPAVAAPRS